MSFSETENFLETPVELVDWTSNEEVIENYEPVTFSLDVKIQTAFESYGNFVEYGK